MKRITLIILAVVVILTGNVSCQKANDIDNNPLSEVALSIIPDFSDGSVYSCSDEGSFFLRVSVKPEKYIEKLSDNDAIICKADFRSVITKANAENPDFTVVGEITSSFVEGGYMTVYFELAEDEVAKLQASDYVVSFSIEDKDNIHVASTSYVPMDNPRGGWGGDVEEEDVIVINGHMAVKLAGYYWATENVGKCSGLQVAYPYFDNSWGCYFYSNKYANRAAQIWGSENGHKWTIPSNEQWQALLSGCYWEWADSYNNPDSPDNERSGYIVFEAKSEEDEGKYGYEAESIYSLATDRHIFLPATGYCSTRDNTYAYEQGTEGMYWSASSSTDFRFAKDWFILHYNVTNPELAFSVRLVSN